MRHSTLRQEAYEHIQSSKDETLAHFDRIQDARLDDGPTPLDLPAYLLAELDDRA